jgi:hypothetical protein
MTPATPTWFLRRYINMSIVDVRDNPKGIVVEVGPPGWRGRRRLLIEGVTKVTELADAPHGRDSDQHEIDIGDDIYERQREQRSECEPD